MNPFPIFDSSIYGGDCMNSGRDLSHWDCAHEKEIRFPYGPDSWRICSSMEGMCKYLLELCTLEGVPFSYIIEFSRDTSYIFCEQHGHQWILEDAHNCLGIGGSHLCHCSNIIVNSVLMCIKHIKNFMLGGEVSRISDSTLKVTNFQCSVMVSTS